MAMRYRSVAPVSSERITASYSPSYHGPYVRWSGPPSVEPTKRGHGIGDPQPVTVIEDAPATPDDRLVVGHPGHAQTWGDVVSVVEDRVDLISDTKIDCDVRPKLPVVLDENRRAVVLVFKIVVVKRFSLRSR
jgi:hypothetical protein